MECRVELFEKKKREYPLAWRMMPESLDEFVGQTDLLGKGKPLRRLIEEERIVSLILYGPPGTGKTALAKIIANRIGSRFIFLNAVTAGVKEIREVVSYAVSDSPVVFIDEIHRFNRLQQDALLPHVESGNIILIGASTENPYFALVPALASRSMIFEFKPLTKEEIITILKRALSAPKGLGEYQVEVEEGVLEFISIMSSGDARKALNILEVAFLCSYDNSTRNAVITKEVVKNSLQDKTLYYDAEQHYDLISAFQKSMRGSDPDATVYWLARMIASGEDPMYIARRIVICAAEDVGNADPRALLVAVAAMTATEKIGLPEARIPLTQAALYVATAPKSNSSILAIDRALESIRNEPLQEVPPHLRDSHYKGAEKLGRGTGYLYPHNYPGHYVKQSYMPQKKVFYTPSSEGYEKEIQKLIEKRRNSQK
jgi:putative ATPase